MRFKMNIKNYKSFKNKQEITFAPITIFVGPNSGGKSSILKLMGLLSQTYSENKSNLVYNGSITDLKDFKSITNNFNGKPVEADFITIQACQDEVGNIRLCNSVDNFSIIIKENQVFVSYRTIKSNTEDKVRNYLTNDGYILSNDEIINIKNRIYKNQKQCLDALMSLNGWSLKETKSKLEYFSNIFINNISIIAHGVPMELMIGGGSNGMFNSINNPLFDQFFWPPYNELREFLVSWDNFEEVLESSHVEHYLFQEIKRFNYVSKKLIEGIGNSEKIKSLPANKEHLDLFDKNKNIFENIKNNSEIKYKDLCQNIIWHMYSDLFIDSFLIELKSIHKQFQDVIKPTVSTLLSNNKFLPPIRKSPKRYYSSVELINYLTWNTSDKFWRESNSFRLNLINESIDMVNQNLKQLEIENTIQVRKVFDHGLPDIFIIEIMDDKTKICQNFCDVGYGFSQMLPILFSLSYLKNEEFTKLIIEQPELHLHPKLQSGLAEIIGNYISRKSRYNSVILETHSEHIIRGIQVQIAQGKISKEDVAVNFVGKHKNGNSFVKRMHLTETGMFEEDWPGGLFEDGYQQSLELLKRQ